MLIEQGGSDDGNARKTDRLPRLLPDPVLRHEHCDVQRGAARHHRRIPAALRHGELGRHRVWHPVRGRRASLRQAGGPVRPEAARRLRNPDVRRRVDLRLLRGELRAVERGPDRAGDRRLRRSVAHDADSRPLRAGGAQGEGAGRGSGGDGRVGSGGTGCGRTDRRSVPLAGAVPVLGRGVGAPAVLPAVDAG